MLFLGVSWECIERSKGNISIRANSKEGRKAWRMTLTAQLAPGDEVLLAVGPINTSTPDQLHGVVHPLFSPLVVFIRPVSGSSTGLNIFCPFRTSSYFQQQFAEVGQV